MKVPCHTTIYQWLSNSTKNMKKDDVVAEILMLQGTKNKEKQTTLLNR
jgi:hypothetical protein